VRPHRRKVHRTGRIERRHETFEDHLVHCHPLN